ncbi:MAG: hypothetical protein Kow00124_18560 [Anaerolineae bacterium]
MGYPVTQTSTLYQLQKLDSRLDQIASRLQAIADLLARDEALRAAQQAVNEAQEALQHWQTRQKDLELERRQLREEGDATEERLYSGRVVNVRELGDLQEKLAELRHRHAALEDPVLEAMFQVEEAARTLETAQARLAQVRTERADALSELTEEQARLEAEQIALREQVTALRPQIAAPHLALYDHLRQRAGGLAVAVIQGEECSACGVEITSLLAQRVRRGEVHQCPTCERILHHP